MGIRPAWGISAAIAALNVACTVHGQTRVVYVDATSTGAETGEDWLHAYHDLNETLIRLSGAEFGADVEVRVAGGVYRAPPSNDPEAATGFAVHVGSFTSAATFSILGAFGGFSSAEPDLRDFVATPTILSGDTLGDDGVDFSNREDNAPSTLSVVNYQGRFLLDGFIVEGGGASINGHGGGGVRLEGEYGEVSVLRNLFVRGNQASSGGGVYAYFCDFEQCRIEGNRARYGGGFEALEGVVTDCIITGNSASDESGGGSCSGGLLQRCIVGGNHAGRFGGGINMMGDTLVQSCLFIGNTADAAGGGVSGYGTLVGCTLVGNEAEWGGGIYTRGSEMANCIMYGNHAGSAGAQAAVEVGVLTFANSIVEGGVPGVFAVFGGTVAAQTVLDSDPLFVNPAGNDGDPANWQDNDYRLTAVSPAVDIGIANGYTAPERDLDGGARIVAGPGGNPAMDIGCYEWRVTCVADWDCSGGTPDDRDIDLFFRDWRDGESRADVNHSGGVPDDADVAAFFDAWNAGC